MKFKFDDLISFDFKNIDRRNLDTWPQTIKNTVILASFVIAFLLVFLYFNMTSYSTLSAAEQQEGLLKQSLLIEIPKVMLLTSQQKQLAQLYLLIKQYNQYLPQAEQLGTLLDDISLAATHNQLNLLLLKPEDSKLTEFYATVPVQIALSGDYQQFGQFFNQLAHLPYFVYPRELTLALPKSDIDNIPIPGSLSLQMTIDMYYPRPKTSPRVQG